MSTPTTPVLPDQKSTLDNLLLIMSVALKAFQAIPLVGPFASIAGAFLNIFIAAKTAHEQITGQPLDLSLIPLEDKLPVPPAS